MLLDLIIRMSISDKKLLNGGFYGSFVLGEFCGSFAVKP